MDILDPNQLAILQAVRAGRYFGDMPMHELQADVDLMLLLRLIEPNLACPYRLTAAGAKLLEVDAQHRTQDQL